MPHMCGFVSSRFTLAPMDLLPPPSPPSFSFSLPFDVFFSFFEWSAANPIFLRVSTAKWLFFSFSFIFIHTFILFIIFVSHMYTQVFSFVLYHHFRSIHNFFFSFYFIFFIRFFFLSSTLWRFPIFILSWEGSGVGGGGVVDGRSRQYILGDEILVHDWILSVLSYPHERVSFGPRNCDFFPGKL